MQKALCKAHPVGHAERNDRVVEVVMRIVQGTAAGTGTIAQPDVTTGFLLQHEGEIFGAHRRKLVSADMFRAEDERTNIATQRTLRNAVDCRRIALFERDLRAHPEHAVDSRANPPQRGFDERLNLRLEGANRAAHHGIVGDDVECLAAMDLGDADHRRLARVDVARHNGLQGEHQMAGRNQCVDPLLRHRGMAPLPADGDLEGAGAGHHRPRQHGQFADRQTRPVVQAEDGVHRETIKESVADHHVGPAIGLLGRLENEMDASLDIERVTILRHEPRGAEQHRRVAVVATGVHSPRPCRAMGKGVLFRQWQGVHVRPQADGASPLSLAQDADNAGSRQTTMDFESTGGEFTSNDVRGTAFLERQFRMGMQVTANGYEPVNERKRKKIHVCCNAVGCSVVYASPACRCSQPSAMLAGMRIVIISGLSGSGKSIALNILEDASYYCVDNLPSQMLRPLVDHLGQQGYDKIAAAIDIRGGDSIAMLPQQLAELRAQHVELEFLFLDAKTDTLLKRYFETRRRHPLADEQRTLTESIAEERRRLERLAELGHHIDTSDLKPNALRDWIRQFIVRDGPGGLTLLFQSFGFKHGVPLDAELVFDVRCLPNPYYEMALRALNGRDQPVIDYLEAEPEVVQMREDIARFIATWLPSYVRDNRSYLTVGIGCTGGQHRSVYFAEWLGRHFRDRARVLVRHRELSPEPSGNP